jgi:hypothetical protein
MRCVVRWTESVPTNLVASEIANSFPMMEGQKLQAIADDIKAQGLLNAIVLWKDPAKPGSVHTILDGRNRYEACKLIGHVLTAENVREFIGTYEEAEAYSNSVNNERRQLTAKDKESYVRKLFAKYPDKSCRKIAIICGYSHVFVAKVKDQIDNPPEKEKVEKMRKDILALPDEWLKVFGKSLEIELKELLETLGWKVLPVKK